MKGKRGPLFVFVGCATSVSLISFSSKQGTLPTQFLETKDHIPPQATPTPVIPVPESKSALFRDRKIMQYENRLRAFSTPDKIFRYFSTLKHAQTGELYMTPADFIRALTPGLRQPEGLGLDSYYEFDLSTDRIVLNLSLEDDSIFFKLGNSGLLAFPDFIFLMTVLSTPVRSFQIAFQMFDLNGDGEVDTEEFDVVYRLMQAHSSAVKGTAEVNLKAASASDALGLYFFGPELKGKLTVEKFLDFHQQINNEITRIEFSQKDDLNIGLITAEDFAELLTSYIGADDDRTIQTRKRVKSKFGSTPSVSLEDYMDFYRFCNSISDIDVALSFYHVAGAAIDRDTLEHLASKVAGVNLNSHLVDIIFEIFDENGDQHLERKEFVSVLQQRMARGLVRPKDTGFIKSIIALYRCSVKAVEMKSKQWKRREMSSVWGSHE
ncbi:unnamed protein product [Cyprideis torosa]|uniref:Uncharacterized protein n=1 Tax=Cyprideis torosa TaxID=163714 RepID=A0A7R8ZM44_9CRUS|nr:unnamed protein product [Cyprideis torosa]CAG0883511.1 unnamed protein product [Cyprideis torosa]